MTRLVNPRPQKMPLHVLSKDPSAVRQTFSDRYRSVVLIVMLLIVLLLIFILL